MMVVMLPSAAVMLARYDDMPARRLRLLLDAATLMLPPAMMFDAAAAILMRVRARAMLTQLMLSLLDASFFAMIFFRHFH